MVNKILEQYLITALWAETDDFGNPLDDNYSFADISQELIDKSEKDIIKFIELAGDLLDDIEPTDIGHDFWLTRNGHGAGFWDGDYPEKIGNQLTEIANQFGQIYLYVAVNDQIYGD